MTMSRVLENFLLYAISDDWAPLAEFDHTIKTLTPHQYSREFVMDIIKEMADKQLIELGSFPGGNHSWEPWDTPVEQGITRIWHGDTAHPGYQNIPDADIATCEIFRAHITPSGRERLAALGDPYENYGDPWYNDPYLKAEGNYPPYKPH